MNDNKEAKTKEYKITKGSLILRIVVSGYLLYTVYQLFGSYGHEATSSTERLVAIIAMIVFTVVAIPMGILSIKAISRGEYAQPMSDTQDEVVEETDNADVESAETESMVTEIESADTDRKDTDSVE